MYPLEQVGPKFTVLVHIYSWLNCITVLVHIYSWLNCITVLVHIYSWLNFIFLFIVGLIISSEFYLLLNIVIFLKV